MSKEKLTLRCPECKKDVQLQKEQNKSAVNAPYYGNFYQCKCPNCNKDFLVSGKLLG